MAVQITIAGRTIECVEGDISAQDTDAIVNAANNHLWMGSGVAGAIKRAGGQVIEDEAVAQGPVQPGDAVVTTAGKLAARYVIHAAGMGQDLRTNADLIARTTRQSLLRAEENDITSVSFPSIGTGVGGFPLQDCAHVMIGEAANHMKSADSVERIRFVLWGQEAYDVFAPVLNEYGDE